MKNHEWSVMEKLSYARLAIVLLCFQHRRTSTIELGLCVHKMVMDCDSSIVVRCIETIYTYCSNKFHTDFRCVPFNKIVKKHTEQLNECTAHLLLLDMKKKGSRSKRLPFVNEFQLFSFIFSQGDLSRICLRTEYYWQSSTTVGSKNISRAIRNTEKIGKFSPGSFRDTKNAKMKPLYMMVWDRNNVENVICLIVSHFIKIDETRSARSPFPCRLKMTLNTTKSASIDLR